MGGFVASLLVMQAMGLILDAAGDLLVLLVPAGVDRPVRDLGARRGRHPDHPPQGAPTDELKQERMLLEGFEIEPTTDADALVVSDCGRTRGGWPS